MTRTVCVPPTPACSGQLRTYRTMVIHTRDNLGRGKQYADSNGEGRDGGRYQGQAGQVNREYTETSGRLVHRGAFYRTSSLAHRPPSPHQNMTLRYVPHCIASQPPSGSISQESGIVQLGSPHRTRTTNGSMLKTATAIAVRPTTLDRVCASDGRPVRTWYQVHT